MLLLSDKYEKSLNKLRLIHVMVYLPVKRPDSWMRLWRCFVSVRIAATRLPKNSAVCHLNRNIPQSKKGGKIKVKQKSIR